MVGLKRRQFIGLGVAGLAGALSLKGWQRLQAQRAIAPTINPPSPSLYRSENGVLEVNLEAGYSDLILGEKNAVGMMTYNGQIPAPRLEVKPGDRLIIHLKNTLDQITNLHFHGLHVSPEGNQDNVFLEIKPNETFTYELKIHPEQRAGTYWYHPHLHGVVAEQVARGLAGLIVVRGDVDQIPEIAAAQEEFLVLQDFAIEETGGMMSSNHMNMMAGREGKLITVNGQFNPTIEVQQDLLRLRLLNASPSRFYRLQLKGHQLIQIATDGGALSQPIARDELLLTPGERADFLLKANELPEIPIHLLNLPYQRTGMGMMGQQYSNHIQSLVEFQAAPKTFNTVEIPAQLIAVEPLPEPQQTRQLKFSHGMAPGVGMTFLINGEPYQHHPQITVDLDTVEDWELISQDVMDHPFHLHTNPFQIVSRNGVLESDLAWHDTVLVPVGGTVKIRVAFRDFVGKTVYHCHILDHEDLGMMGQLQINPA